MQVARVSLFDLSRAVSVFAAVLPLALTGCGEKTADQNAPAGQVIAHVGTNDVTAQELENEFRLANLPFDKRSDAVTKRVLGEIVLRKYAVQQAIAAKLDREPTVHLDILRAREQVLTNAVLQRDLTSKTSSIGKSEIDQFIGAHPDQFAKREIFNVERIGLTANAETQGVVDATNDFKTLDQVSQKLGAMGIPYTRSTGVLDGGDLPSDFLSHLQARKTDDIFFVRNGSNATFFKVTGEEPRPLTGEEAENRAREMMRVAAFKAIGEQIAQAAEASAKYEGEYAKIMGKQSPDKENKEPAKN